MRKIYLITAPSGERIACSSVEHMLDVLTSEGVGYEDMQGLIDNIRANKAKPFTKTEFIPWEYIQNGYKIEVIRFYTGSRWKTFSV